LPPVLKAARDGPSCSSSRIQSCSLHSSGLSTGVRIRFVFTHPGESRQYSAGLQQLKVDATKEEDLSRTVPYLVREPFERREGTHLIPFLRGQCYRTEMTTTTGSDGVPKFVLGALAVPRDWEGGAQDKWSAMDVSLKAAYILGWRYLSFSAFVTVLDGRGFRRSRNGIEPDVFMGWPKKLPGHGEQYPRIPDGSPLACAGEQCRRRESVLSVRSNCGANSHGFHGEDGPRSA